MRRRGRWLILLAAASVALVFFARATEGAGQPAWLERAYAQTCYGMAALAAGIGAFRILKRLPQADPAGLGFSAAAVLALFAPWIRALVNDPH